MAVLTWDDVGERFYESGVKNGVLYDPLTGKATPWNGLVSVDETVMVAQSEPSYYDGTTLFPEQESSIFTGVLTAFTFPDIFNQYVGMGKFTTGVYVANQTKQEFNLSYKTLIGNDLEGSNSDYKIHIHYGLTASQQTISRTSQAGSITPFLFKWNLIGSLTRVNGIRRPTGYFQIDSRTVNPDTLTEIQNMLYGTTDDDPSLPDINVLVDYLAGSDSNIIRITDNGDGSWTADGPNSLITFIDADTFTLENVNIIGTVSGGFVLSTV